MISNLSIDLNEKIKIEIKKILSNINDYTKIDYYYQELKNIIIYFINIFSLDQI